MALNDGQKLTLLAMDLKQNKGMTSKEIAKRAGISYPHLSRQFSKAWITPEIKKKIIDGLRLPADFFETDNTPAPADITTTAEPDELELKRRELERRTAQLLELSEKYSALSEQFRKYVLENPPKQE